jgi:hypothetical protein
MRFRAVVVIADRQIASVSDIGGLARRSVFLNNDSVAPTSARFGRLQCLLRHGNEQTLAAAAFAARSHQIKSSFDQRILRGLERELQTHQSRRWSGDIRSWLRLRASIHSGCRATCLRCGGA